MTYNNDLSNYKVKVFTDNPDEFGKVGQEAVVIPSNPSEPTVNLITVSDNGNMSDWEQKELEVYSGVHQLSKQRALFEMDYSVDKPITIAVNIGQRMCSDFYDSYIVPFNSEINSDLKSVSRMVGYHGNALKCSYAGQMKSGIQCTILDKNQFAFSIDDSKKYAAYVNSEWKHSFDYIDNGVNQSKIRVCASAYKVDNLEGIFVFDYALSTEEIRILYNGGNWDDIQMTETMKAGCMYAYHKNTPQITKWPNEGYMGGNISFIEDNGFRVAKPNPASLRKPFERALELNRHPYKTGLRIDKAGVKYVSVMTSVGPRWKQKT